jgi:uncharacterized spore protein YtfJ
MNNMNFEELLDKVTSFIQTEARTETVIGEPFKLGEFNCIPVIRIGLGFGTGGGEGEDVKHNHGGGGGAGGGMGIEPIGFLVAHGEMIQFVSTKQNKGLALAFEKVPGLIEKYMEMKSKEPIEAV